MGTGPLRSGIDSSWSRAGPCAAEGATSEGDGRRLPGGEAPVHAPVLPKRSAVLPGSSGAINTVQLSDNGRTLVATSLDGTLSLYDVASGTRLGDPIPHSARDIYPGFLRHDGGELATTDRTGVVIWDLDPEHLREAAFLLAGRNLTETEWDTYLADLGAYRPTCSG